MSPRSASSTTSPGDLPSDEVIATCIAELLDARARGASICPSDVARALCTDEAQWRAAMPRIREVARALARAGKLQVTQKQRALDPDATWRGPVRLRKPAAKGG